MKVFFPIFFLEQPQKLFKIRISVDFCNEIDLFIN